MNKQRLKGEIVSKYGTQDAFAQAIGWHKNKVSNVLTGKRKLDTDEVSEIVSLLNLSESTFIEIFLSNKLPNGNTQDTNQPQEETPRQPQEDTP